MRLHTAHASVTLHPSFTRPRHIAHCAFRQLCLRSYPMAKHDIAAYHRFNAARWKVISLAEQYFVGTLASSFPPLNEAGS
jgi:hypothetical protein